MQRIKIFIASPSDVKKERDITGIILKKLKRKYKEHYEIEWIFWEDKPLVSTSSYQAGIDNPSSTELVIFILWSTLGSDLDSTYKGKKTDKQPITGTEWEYEEAVSHYEKHNKPEILVYKKDSDILCSIDDSTETREKKIDDKSKLDKFIQHWFINEDGTFKGAYHQFKESEKFENKLETHLETWIKDLQKEKIKLNTKIDERIDDLKNKSLTTFKSQKVDESLQKSKKCAEFICQIISLKEEEYFDIEKYNKNPNEFIDNITKDIFKVQDRDFLRAYLKLLIYNGDYASTKNITHENVKISNKCLQRLLKWLYTRYLNREMPIELTKYLSKYDILINYNDTDKEWINTLVKNFEINNYKVFLLNGEKQKIDEYKKLNQAFSEIKACVLVCSNSINDKKWLTKERAWIKEQQREILEFNIIPVYSKKSNLKNENFIDFSIEYKSKFSDLINKIEKKSIPIEFANIQEPMIQESIKKSIFPLGYILILISLLVAALFIVKIYIIKPEVKPDIVIYTARTVQSPYGMIGENIVEYVAKDAKISIKTKLSSGSYANLEKLAESNEGQLTMVIVQADVLQEYIVDKRANHKIKNFKVLALLHKEEFHLIVRADSNLTSFDQIIEEGVRVDVGKKKSGPHTSSKFLVKEMFSSKFMDVDIKEEDKNTTLRDVLTKLKNNETDVVVVIAGQPLKVLNDYEGLKLLTYDKELLLKKRRELGIIEEYTNSYAESDITSYVWNDTSVHTLNTRAYLVVYDDGKNNQELLKKFANSYVDNLCKIKKLAIKKNEVHIKWLEIPEHLEDLPKGLSYSPIIEKVWGDPKQPITECVH